MGLLASRWEANWEGLEIVVSRNELTKGYKLTCDGKELSSKSMSLVGVGELEGQFVHEGQPRIVRVTLDTECTITVDGTRLAVRSVK